MLKIVNYNKDEYDFPALIVLGCFDAVHIGHQELLKKAKLQAKINGLDLGVMMFAEGKGGRQVFTFEERQEFISAYNTKFVFKIDYTDEFKKTTAQQFLGDIEEYINVKAYMSGKDFRFGAGAKGKSSTLKNFAEDEENGVWYMPVKDVTVDGEKVSTTLIKKYIEEGKIQKAEQLLGRQYFVSGEVCEGHGRGKELGFPTANIIYPANKVLVAPGVYGVEAEIDGTVYKGVANCGPRPTFGEDAFVMEVYFEGLSQDLYGKNVTVKFINYIRAIKKFESAEALSAQIAHDVTCIGAPDAEFTEPAAEVVEEAHAEEPAVEAVEEVPAEEPVAEAVEEAPAEEPVAEVVEEAPAEEPVAEVVEEAPVEEPTTEVVEEVPAEEPVAEVVEEAPAEEPAAEVVEEVPAEEPVAEVVEETPAEESAAEVVEEATAEEPATEVVEEAPAEEPVVEVAEEAPAEEPATEVVEGAPVEEPVAEAVEEAPAEEPAAEAVEETPAEEPVAEVVEETSAEEPAAEVVEEAPAEEPAAEVSEEAPAEDEEEDGEEAVAEDDSGEKPNKKRRRKGRGKSDRRRGDNRKR